MYKPSHHYLTGEVLFYGCESIRNGEYGLPHCRNDGQARVSRLLCGGSHGQGNVIEKLAYGFKLMQTNTFPVLQSTLQIA